MKRKKYPINWNLKDIYKSEKEWYKELKFCNNYLSKIKKLKGTINSAKGIYNFINVVDTSKFAKIDDKLSLYISLLQSLNVNDKKAKKNGIKV